MKLALSRKNLWERCPRPMRRLAGAALTPIPLPWLLGGRFRQAYQFVQESQWWDEERIKQYQLERLKAIVTLAYERSDFYRELFQGVGFEPGDLKQPADLLGLPRIDKHIVRENLHRMLTQPSTLPSVDYMSTSGTGGTPLSFYIGADRSAVEFAHLASSWARVGYRPGMRLAVLRGQIVRPDRSGLYCQYDPLLRSYTYSSFHLTAEHMHRYVSHMHRVRPDYLHAYPSSAFTLARFMHENNLSFPSSVKGVLMESEPVYPHQRSFIEEHFPLRAYASYGHTEKLVLAAECEYSTHYHAWPTYGFLELLGPTGQPIEPGQVGEIVGTGFINRVVPFIRYRTDDYAELAGTGCPHCGRQHICLSRIVAHRSQEFLVAQDGRPIMAWAVLNMHDETFDGITQFQFVQKTPGRAELFLVPGSHGPRYDLSRIQAHLSTKLGGQLEIALQVCPNIPPNPSGKKPLIRQQIPHIDDLLATYHTTGGDTTPITQVASNSPEERDTAYLCPHPHALRSRRAWSRKNLWERLPGSGTTRWTRALGLIPPRFWLGTRFRKHLRLLNDAQWWSATQNSEYQLAQLRRICTLAYLRTPYYRRFFDAAGVDPQSIKSLNDLCGLPTIDKEVLRRHLTAMCTVPPTSKQLDLVSTGGTGGQPFHFYAPAGRSAIEYAHLVASWERIGYRLNMPLVVLRGRVVPKNHRGFEHAYDPVLRHHHYSTFDLTDEYIRRAIDHIRTLGPCFLHAYPSSAAVVARCVQRLGLTSPANIHGIIVESETLYPEQRELIERTFGTRLFSSYGHSEKLILATECEHSNDYHVWPTYGFLELLDEQGHRVTTPGQRGEIVGTGWINDVVPFIRYRTGDYAEYVGEGCSKCGRQHTIIRRVEGRWPAGDLVAQDGSLISMTSLNVHDDTFTRVQRFQFYQDTPGQAVLKVVPAIGFGDEDRQRIAHSLGARLAGRIDLAIELVQTIPLSPRGKSIYVDQRIHLESAPR